MKKPFDRSLILKENLNKNGVAIEKDFYDLKLIKEIQKKFNLFFEKNKNQYELYSKTNHNFKIKNFLNNLKEKIIYLLCHFELLSKWYLKRRIKILKNKNI